METKALNFKSLLTFVALLLFLSFANGQTRADSSAHVDREIISSIAAYPADVRKAILDVAQYPQVLIKIERVQARSSQSFQDLIAPFPREEQEKFYEASRFPDMVDLMVRSNNLSNGEIKGMVKDLPEKTQQRLIGLYQTHFDDLVRMNNLYNASQESLQDLIVDYPHEVRQHFEKVISNPEIMSLLTDNIDLTVSLGEEYKDNPDDVNRRLAELNSQVNEQKEKDLAEFKSQVANDPKLQDEMKSAASEFSNANDQPSNPVYVTNNYYDSNPYPYWFSYPYWYQTAIWYPRPFYYHTGFYYGSGGGLVVVGLPSLIYSNWFFGWGYRHYPLMYNRYQAYYNNYHNRFGYAYNGFRSGRQNRYNDGRGTYSRGNNNRGSGQYQGGQNHGGSSNHGGGQNGGGGQHQGGGNNNGHRNMSGSSNFTGIRTHANVQSGYRNLNGGQVYRPSGNLSQRNGNQYNVPQGRWQQASGGSRSQFSNTGSGIRSNFGSAPRNNGSFGGGSRGPSNIGGGVRSGFGGGSAPGRFGSGGSRGSSFSGGSHSGSFGGGSHSGGSGGGHGGGGGGGGRRGH